MLVINCKIGEVIKIGDNVEIKITQVKGNSARIAFDAPPDIIIDRQTFKQAEIVVKRSGDFQKVGKADRVADGARLEIL